jgi:hypothetical protein
MRGSKIRAAKEILLYTLRTGAGEAEIGAEEQCGAVCSKQWDFWSRICMKGARFQREREGDHELFEYGVLVTHVFKVRDFREREIMARWDGVLWSHIHGKSFSFREKEIICHL